MDVEARVHQVISKTFGIDQSTLDCDSCFPDDMAKDSLDIIELVMELEKEFNLRIPDEDIDQIVTVGQAVEYIRAHYGASV